jgi:S-DNA-T family DNA segregation ATPase FtsK/SpoIIIE
MGQGDMLYLAGDVAKPVRVQGVYVDSKEIERVTNRIKLSSVEPQFVDEITSHETARMKVPGVPGGKSMAGDDVDDDMYDDALALIIETGKASASLLQRRLKLGYARSARLLDIMEEKGVVGPSRGAKPREIYVGRH